MTQPLHLIAVLLARFGLAAGYLSSVVDRFGGWGRPGAAGVVWGDFQHFITRIETLSPTPPALAPILAWLVTVLESSLGLAFLVGLRTRLAGLVSGCLLLVFALVTAFSPAGIHAVLSASILSGAGASLLLAVRGD